MPSLSARCRTVGRAARPPMLTAGWSAGSPTRRPIGGPAPGSLCSSRNGVVYHLITSVCADGRPQQAFPVRSRLRRTRLCQCRIKAYGFQTANPENYCPRPLQRERTKLHWNYYIRFRPRRLQILVNRAKICPGAALFLLMFNNTYAGGHRLNKTPPRRPLRGRHGGLFC